MSCYPTLITFLLREFFFQCIRVIFLHCARGLYYFRVKITILLRLFFEIKMQLYLHPQYRVESPTDEASTCRALFHSAGNCPAEIVLKVAPGQRMHLLGKCISVEWVQKERGPVRGCGDNHTCPLLHFHLHPCTCSTYPYYCGNSLTQR